MRRMLLVVWLAAGPLLLISAAGCEQEVRTQTHSERIEESPPRMVSPGEPIVE